MGTLVASIDNEKFDDPLWKFQNRRARTKKKMEKTGQSLNEVLGNPKRPTFGNLPEPMIKLAQKRKMQRKEEKRQERRERERANKPKRVKIELTRSLLREENDPPLDWLCPRAQAEKAARDKLKSVRHAPNTSWVLLTPSQGNLKGIDSWSAPAYAYPTEWSEETRDTWWQIDIPCVSKFEHKSTPHPNEPKDVTVTDEEMDALEKQFTGLKIEVLQKIYWHQYPDGRLEAIHPKLVRVRKDGTFFMYDDEELQEGSHTTRPPRPTRPRRGDCASRPIVVDQPGTSASDPITVQDPGSSAKEPIVLDIPGATAANPIFVGLPGTSVSDAIVVDVPGTSATDPIVVHYPGISISDPIVVDVPGVSASDPIVVDTKEAPFGPSALPRAINPIVVVNIPEATEEDMGLAGYAEVKGASKGKGRMPSHESTPESDSGSSRASTSPGTGFSPFNASFAISSPSLPIIGNAISANRPDILGTQLGLPPALYPYPHDEIQRPLPPGIFDVPASGLLPGDLSIPDPFAMSVTTGIPTDYLPVNSATPEVPVIDPVQTQQRRTLQEEFAEIFKDFDVYNPQVQFSPQGEIDWDAPLEPPTVAMVYQSIPEVPGSAGIMPAPVPQAQIMVEPQLDLLTQMQTGQFDTWEALFGDTYLELPRTEDIPPPSAWEGPFDPTLQEFFDRFWVSEAATSAGAAPTADSSSAFVALPSQGLDTFKL